MTRYRIWYDEGAGESGPWTTRAETPAAATEAMHAWFAECGAKRRATVTRIESVAEPAPAPYDAAAHLRSLRWITG